MLADNLIVIELRYLKITALSKLRLLYLMLRILKGSSTHRVEVHRGAVRHVRNSAVCVYMFAFNDCYSILTSNHKQLTCSCMFTFIRSELNYPRHYSSNNKINEKIHKINIKNGFCSLEHRNE